MILTDKLLLVLIFEGIAGILIKLWQRAGWKKKRKI